MLLVQEISLTWQKEERGLMYARRRTQFPLAYSLEGFVPDKQAGVNYHYLSFHQKGTKFMDSIQDFRQFLEQNEMGWSKKQIQKEMIQRIRWIKKYRFRSYSSVLDLNLANLSISPCKEGYEVVFFYDEHRSGKPFRRGHNKDFNNPQSLFYRRDCLNEVAFILEKEQYGRIIWNERRTDFDTGEWYYQMHIFNLLYSEKRIQREDIFLKHRLNFEYKQMVLLY